MPHKLLGKGGYGCGFFPALSCTDPKKNSRAVVGKVFYDEDSADIEINQAKLLKSIDPEQKFFLYPVDRCTVSIDTLLKDGMECVEDIDDVHGQLPPQVQQLLMPNGGKTLSQYLKDLREPLTRTQALRLVRPLFQGVQLLQKHGMVHQDIKTPNIVINDRNRVRLIDWGTAMDDMETVYADINNMYLPPGFDHVDENGLPEFVYCISPPEYRIVDYRKYVRKYRIPINEIPAQILFIEEAAIYRSKWVPRPLHGWYSYYKLNNASQHSMMNKLFREFNVDTFKKMVPITAADVYGLGFLLFCLSPWLVDPGEEDKEVLNLYDRLVYGMMKCDPRKRLTIGEAITMMQMTNLPRFSKTPVQEWMKTQALFPSQKPSPSPMTPPLPLPAVVAPNTGRDFYMKTYSRMTVKDLKQTDIYKEITRKKHNKSKLAKQELVDLIVSRLVKKETA